MNSVSGKLPRREDSRVEFKTSFNTAVIETLVAFANTRGGCVFIGVNDDGTPVPGFAPGKEAMANWVNEAKTKTHPALIPDIEILEVSGTSIVRLDSETIIRDNATIRGDLFSEVESCMEFVRKHISKRYVISGEPRRNEVWEYPLEVVREIVINMVVHRDYRAIADSTIKIYDGRIEFYNPGGLPDGVSLDDILSGRSPSIPRNKQVAAIFKEAGTIEKYGSGIRRVLEILKGAGARGPQFDPMPHCFKVTLFPVAVKSGGANGGVNELLEYIRHNPGRRVSELNDALSIPRRTLERRLKELKDQGLVHFNGAPKTGGYYPTQQ